MSEIPFVEWDAFTREFVWNHDEHVSGIGPTGTGKTTLLLALLPHRRMRRRYDAIIGTKPADSVLDRLIRRDGFDKVTALPRHPNVRGEQLVVWPRWRGDHDTPAQARAIRLALSTAFAMGTWCVFADEVAYLCDDLRLAGKLRTFWRQGRSVGISLVAATQRPAFVPKDLYSAPSHLFFWRTNDDDDLRRIGGLNGVSNRLVRETVAALPRHEALYVNTRTGELARTQCPPGR